MEIVMFSLCRQRKPYRSALRRLRAVAAFTLVEIVISLAVLGTMASGVYIGFNALNAYAVSSRLYSEALTAAQNQVDLVLSKEPFDTTAANVSGTFNPCLNKVPVELMTTAELDALATSGTCGVTFPTTAPSATPATTNAYYPYYPYFRTAAGQPLQKQAFIYHDPTTGLDVVTGTLTSTVTDTAMTMAAFANTSAGATPSPLNARQAHVSVTYNFRVKNYDVSMDTIRTADQ
jgi:prepilin-type N-terminal cleavage/methylation domain-containing protein